MLAADDFPCAGLLLLAYPLHRAGQPESCVTRTCPAITTPVLCINGTRDPLCNRELMEAVLARVGANWCMHWLEGADHSFHVLKSSGRSDSDVLNEIADVSSTWQTGVRPPR